MIESPAPPSSGAPTAPPRREPDAVDRELAECAARSRRLSTVRVVAFFVAAIGTFGATKSAALLAIGVAGVVAFVIAFVLHGRVLSRSRHLENLRLLADEETARRSTRRRVRSLPEEPGPEEAHPLARGLRVYAPEPQHHELDRGAGEDLAVLRGPRSLFGFLDVSSSLLGARRLAYMLRHPLASTEAIRTRQAAVRAIAEADATRRALLETLIPLRSYSFDRVPAHLRAPSTFARRTGVAVLANVLGTALPILLIASAFSPGLLSIAFLIGIVNFGIIGAFVRDSNAARDRLLAFDPLLRRLLDVDRVLAEGAPEDESWREIAKLLAGLRADLTRLARWTARLELHSYGVIFEILNVLTLWELRILPPAERVYESTRDSLENALGALGEVEALLSLAGPLAEQSGFVLPEPDDGNDPLVEARALGHPLLDPDALVRNDVSMAARSNVVLVTGSNMAGKSTYLKSLGANVVLAGTGGPVCAEAFRWTPLRVYSDINVRDSLDDGKSYFQVEVERVLDVIREARTDRRILAIFDELFRGTNVEERLAIARALLRHLRDLGILLVVATHDGALTKLVTEERETGMRNFHFRETVDGRAMTFDYRLREGPAPTRNAIRVLEACGYPPEVVERAKAERDTDG